MLVFRGCTQNSNKTITNIPLRKRWTFFHPRTTFNIQGDMWSWWFVPWKIILKHRDFFHQMTWIQEFQTNHSPQIFTSQNGHLRFSEFGVPCQNIHLTDGDLVPSIRSDWWDQTNKKMESWNHWNVVGYISLMIFWVPGTPSVLFF